MRAQGQTQTEAQAAQPRRPAAGDAASPDEVTEASLLDALHQLLLEHRDPAPGAARSHRRNRTCDDVRNNFSRVQPRPLSAASTTTSVLSPVIMAMQAEMARRGAINEAENEDQDQDQDAPAPGVLSAPAATSGALAAGTLHALESPLPSASLIEALSATRSPMSHPQHLHGTRPFSSPGHRGRVLAPARSNSIVPVRAAPDESIRGRHGLRRHRLLPSKRHVLTQDTQGRVSLWDIMLCRRLHVFPESAEAAASSAQFPGVFGTDFDTVATAIAPDPEAISSWCHVDTHTGSLTVHLDEASVWSAEVHVDEVDGVSQETVNAMGDHERVNIGQWMLKRLFLGYTRARVKQGPLPPQDAALLNRWAAQIPAGEVVSVRPQGQPPLQTPYPLNGTPQPPQAAHDGGTEGKRPAPSIASSLSPGRTSDADIPSGGSAGKFLNRLRSMRMRKQRSTLSTSTSSRSPLMDAATLSPENEDGTGQQDRAPARPNVTRTTSAPGVVPNGASKTASAADGRASANQLAHDDFAEWAGPRFPTDTERSVALLQAVATPWDQLYSPVVCPRLPLPRNVTIQIFQECVDASGPYCIYRCVADTIGSRAPGDSFMSAFCITDDLLLSFELCMPAWLTDFLLFNRLPAAYQEPAKIAFVLGPSPASTLPPLPNPNARLVANRMLRARKLAIYVVEKLGLPLMDRPPASYVGAVETCMRAYASAPEQPAPPAASTDNAYASAFARAGETLSEAELAALDDVVRWQGAQRAAGEGAAANYQGRPELYVALLCKDKHVPPKHTLATIKASIWKSSSDVQIHYEWAGFIKKRVARAQHIRQQSPEQ
ncbi:hypothetical protein H4R21_002755 [Coemansia helicoidea]|uniref:Uncharacterized protein n=1 Tax=Coemansia helicoidea TaxID=1286919 RepID=A0ACC1L6T4_9FUNG|nr:hypothetical protein H4R21_002755 [Coemansia helicoidea]